MTLTDQQLNEWAAKITETQYFVWGSPHGFNGLAFGRKEDCRDLSVRFWNPCQDRNQTAMVIEKLSDKKILPEYFVNVARMTTTQSDIDKKFAIEPWQFFNLYSNTVYCIITATPRQQMEAAKLAWEGK